MNVHSMEPIERVSVAFARLPKTKDMLRARMTIAGMVGPFDLEDLARTIVAVKKDEKRKQRMELINDDLAERAIAKGMDPYEVVERAAILEFEDGWPQRKAEAYALNECTCEGEKCAWDKAEKPDPFAPVENDGGGGNTRSGAVDPFA